MRLLWVGLIGTFLLILTMMVRLTAQSRTSAVATASREPKAPAQPARSPVRDVDDEQAPRNTAARPARRSSRGVATVSLALGLVMVASLVGAGTVLADQPITSSPPGATVIPWPGDEANQASYWSEYLQLECEKFNVPGDFTTNQDYAAIVVKGGTYNFIWQPAPAGTYSTNPEVSHYYLCTGFVEDELIDPRASIEGPCADPAYYAIFDNTSSTVTIKFRFRWYNNKGIHVITKDVPAGAMYTTWQHWVKPFTLMRVGYKDPNTGVWINLAQETSVKGRYPACQYSPGFSFPNP